MPFVSQAQRRYMHAQHPTIAKRWDKEFPNQKGLPGRKKKKYKIGVNNKLRGTLGQVNINRKGKVESKDGVARIQINIKGHKGDKAELASTVKHELLHVKHPKMTEKTIYKKSAKTKIPLHEQEKLLSKLRMKKLNYKGGAIKRKYKMGRGATKPGELISKMNEQKRSNIKSNNKTISKTRLAIMGLV